MKTYLFGTLLFASIAVIWAQTLTNSTCTDVECCRNLANPNPATGDGYLEFNGQCLTPVEGFSCVDGTGCLLCHNGNSTTNLFNRPICGVGAVFPLPACSDQGCCTSVMSPNTITGYGYLEFTTDCLSGGLHCVDNSGCLDCFNPTVTNESNVLERPVCSENAINSFNLGTGTTAIIPITVVTTPQTTVLTTAQTTVLTTPLTTVLTTPATTVQTAPQTTIQTAPQTTILTAPQTTVFTVPKTTIQTAPQTTIFTTPQTTQVPVPLTTQVPVPLTTQVPVPLTTQVTTPLTTQIPTPVPLTSQVIFTQQQVSTIPVGTNIGSGSSVAPAFILLIVAAAVLQ